MLRNLLKHGDSRYKTIEELAQAIRTEARYALDKVEE
jgi:phage-related protein